MLFPFLKEHLFGCFYRNQKGIKQALHKIFVFTCLAEHMHTLGTVLLTTESFIKLQENHFVQGKKRKHNHVENISSYTQQKEACFKKLDETNDLEKINFSEMAQEFELLNENGKKWVIYSGGRSVSQCFCSISIKKSSTVNATLKFAT